MSAIISVCGQYRYQLARPGGTMTVGEAPAVFVMLNPSTADETLDDPTIRRCRSFAAQWGNDGIIVANLYALRSTDPAALWKHRNPIGPDNDDHLYELAISHGRIVCAWGANAEIDRVRDVAKIFRDAGAKLLCLGVTNHGAPRHPLYVRADQPLIEWTEPA
jgi:hypothetical protein